ncbi:Kinesin [Thalictrum thalictroides]|uniref:Kinesin n=1 Tax=Thalictrum thalictroides TaxID=46969 RepID=A0A7J6WS92_THATH|nr:Kinesin [Thalictrum thalictroides]
MEDLKSPLLECPSAVTVRRNPPRRAKAPFTTTSNSTPASKSLLKRKEISSFPLQEILQCQLVPPPLHPTSSSTSSTTTTTATNNNHSEHLRVFLRIKPLNSNNSTTTTTTTTSKQVKGKAALPALKKKSLKKTESDSLCLVVNDSQSVTLTPPQSLQDAKRFKSEVYDGFTQVFDTDSTQIQVYEKVMEPLVVDFMDGKSGMVAAMGPTGSGKTHTIFGSPKNHGMISLAFAHIFGLSTSSYYISMFEIYSERGKGEKLIDLSSSDGPDLFLQQSSVRGLQEVMISSVVEAEAVIARGMLRRATAVTNSNSQSSRSQCIINIRGAPEMADGDEVLPNNAVLTIVDLAGAEREKKTGNQGTRLLESNFINNTSMVFGLCLRSLLEHQKNPKKPLQKHFQNSLLTKYLREYLEGKKRMALILTVKAGVDDYLDASFLLRQASPYMKIKFNVIEEEPCQKRNISKLPREEKPKRRKLSDPDAYKIDESKSGKDPRLETELVSVPLQQQECLHCSISSSRSAKLEINERLQLEEYRVEINRLKRNEQVMLKFSKALWNVLKQYKSKLEETENEVRGLKESLEKENVRYVELEKEKEELMSCSRYFKQQSAESSDIQSCENGIGNGGKCINDDDHSNGDKKERDSWPSDSIVSSSIEQFLVENATCSATEQSTVLGEDEMTSHASEVSPNEESGSVDRCNASIGDLRHSSSKIQKEKQQRRRIPSPSMLVKERNDLETDNEMIKDSQILPTEKAGSVDTCSMGKIDSENISSCKSLSEKKPRRRLLPASSVLLREINDLDLNYENERPMGSSRGGRKLAADGIGRTQGSVSLLKLLSNLNL